MSQIKQPWFCDDCRAMGVIVAEADAGVFEVSRSVREAHQKSAPYCLSEERVLVLDNIHETVLFMPPIFKASR